MAILLIEDDKLMRVTLDDALTSEGYSVISVETLKDAYTALRSSIFDLVITDVRLPDGEGLSIMKEVIHSHDAQVIVMTAYGDIKQKAHAMKSGAFEYVTKPFDLGVFLGFVRRALDEKRESSYEAQ